LNRNSEKHSYIKKYIKYPEKVKKTTERKIKKIKEREKEV
jgi:hypothetical protein